MQCWMLWETGAENTTERWLMQWNIYELPLTYEECLAYSETPLFKSSEMKTPQYLGKFRQTETRNLDIGMSTLLSGRFLSHSVWNRGDSLYLVAIAIVYLLQKMCAYWSCEYKLALYTLTLNWDLKKCFPASMWYDLKTKICVSSTVIVWSDSSVQSFNHLSGRHWRADGGFCPAAHHTGEVPPCWQHNTYGQKVPGQIHAQVYGSSSLSAGWCQHCERTLSVRGHATQACIMYV